VDTGGHGSIPRAEGRRQGAALRLGFSFSSGTCVFSSARRVYAPLKAGRIGGFPLPNLGPQFKQMKGEGKIRPPDQPPRQLARRGKLTEEALSGEKLGGRFPGVAGEKKRPQRVDHPLPHFQMEIRLSLSLPEKFLRRAEKIQKGWRKRAR